MTASHGAPSSPFRQPTAVWAVAFGCVVSFMGPGLVDPILRDIARQLHATPSQTELVFWRGPVFGVSVLMAIALVATVVFVDSPPATARTPITAPLKALRHRGLATMSLTALCYNWGFTALGYRPFPMNLGIHQLGYVFTAWGVLLAIFAVFVAPRAQRRFGTPWTRYRHLLRVTGDHGASGRAIADFARRRQAQLVVVGAPHDGAVGGRFDMTLTDQLIRHSPGEVRVRPAEISQ